jgi:peptidoglycan-associated lipoprotein
MSLSRKAGLALLGLTLVAAGCRKQPPPAVAATPQAPPAATQNPVQQVSNSQPTNNNAELEARIRGTLEQMVFFDYDDSSIRDDSKQLLDSKIPLLRQYSNFSMVIEGHADERGSTEYNLALGTRRAVAVMEYLTGFGLNASRFRTFSYGEERPLVQGEGESVWARNRRAEFRVSGSISER